MGTHIIFEAGMGSHRSLQAASTHAPL